MGALVGRDILVVTGGDEHLVIEEQTTILVYIDAPAIGHVIAVPLEKSNERDLARQEHVFDAATEDGPVVAHLVAA